MRWAQLAFLFSATILPLSWRGIQATSYSGWPALGFAVAFLLAAGAQRLRFALGSLLVAVSLALSFSYEVSIWVGLLGSLAVVVPAWLTQHLLAREADGRIRLDEVDSGRYHLVTALSAALCSLLTLVAAATVLDVRDTLLAGLISFLSALTAQLAVLPLVIPTSGRRATGSAAELWAQRVVLVVVMLAVFWPTTRLAVAFMVFPMLGWAAVRSTRREAHLQLFAVCTSVYVLTYYDRGPFSGEPRGLPAELTPVLVYLFVGAACYMTVPLALAVERMFAATARATRAATTVERLLSSASGTIFVATDAVGQITHFNAGAQHTLGYTPEEVLGRSPAMFHSPEEVARHAAHFGVEADHTTVVLEMARRGERRDWEFLRKDGTTRMASLTLTEVDDADGAVVGYIGSGEDITERLRAQEALMTALDREHASVLRLEEVDHVKQELVSNVSHELRTPITSISGYAELLADGSLGELNPEQVEAMRRIERNTDRLGLLVDDLLTLSRAESGQLELEHVEVDLRRVASEAFDLLQDVLRVRELDVRVELPPDPVTVLGDAHALERVVTNLIGNAIKFTPDGGSIVLGVTSTGTEARLTVCDTGLGIPEEDQDRLFTRFYRAASATEQAIQGTGLGLSIVHSIVTQHGGTVSVDSARGAGTTVTVVLPAAEPG
jgi:PAS domain S-box-containing protein